MTKQIDLVSHKFGRWTVQERAANTKAGQSRWRCLCECGAVQDVLGQSLREGKSRSCGCLKAEVTGNRSRTHGATVSRQASAEYRAWANMVSRCGPISKDFQDYGARGIKVCDRWRASFAEFLADMGPRPSVKHSLDRINNEEGYEPENCRWALPVIQQNNKRNNPVFVYRGQRMTLPQAWRSAGCVVPLSVAHSRLARGWPIEAIVEVPSMVPSGKRPKGSRHYEAK